jgi:hypothetical protein
MPAVQRPRLAVTRAAVLVIALTAATLSAGISSARAEPARAGVPAPAEWITVRLPAHDYGRLSTPEAIVATAEPRLFTFAPGHQSATTGPNTFDLAPDGSVWVVGKTFVVWPAASPTTPHTVALPAPAVNDFGIAVDGTVYVTSGYGGPQMLYAISPTGRVLWKAPRAADAANAPLRIGGDKVVYVEAPSSGQTGWRPLTTSDGDPLPTQQQRSGTILGLPAGDGRLLAEVSGSAHERRFVLLDRHGTAVRGWRLVDGDDDLATIGSPALVGDDLVVTIAFSREESGRFRYEFETVRLTPSGRVAATVTTSARSVWGDPLTSVRIANAAVYQLETSPVIGVRVVRYTLDAVTATSSTPPGSPSSAASGTPSTPPATAPTLSRGTDSNGTDSRGADGHGSTGLEIATAVGALSSIGVAGLLWWRTRRARPGS